MESYPLLFSGCLFIAGGLIVISVGLHESVEISMFILTEVIAGLLTLILGVSLMCKGIKKMTEEEETETEQDEDSPFYYELEPTAMKR
ncbi:hypothetical protein X975_19173, partial [Stegodyphus mimosarum]